MMHTPVVEFLQLQKPCPPFVLVLVTVSVTEPEPELEHERGPEQQLPLLPQMNLQTHILLAAVAGSAEEEEEEEVAKAPD